MPRNGEGTFFASGLSIGWPVRAVLAGQWSSLLRLSIFMAVAASSVASMVLFLPVALYYRTVDLATSHFDVQVDGLITSEIMGAVEPLAEPGSQVAFLTLDPAVIHANGRSAGHAVIYFTTTPGRLDNSWFPDSSVIDLAEAAGPSWVDISAGVAHELGVMPGDSVEVPIVGRSVQLTVRRVLAVARFGFPNVAVGPINEEVREAFSAAEAGLTPTVLLLRTSRSTGDIRAAVDSVSPPGKTQVLGRTDWLNQEQIDPTLSEPVRAITTALGLACLLGLAIREGHSLFRRRHHELIVLLAIGVDRRKLTGTLLLLEASSISIALAFAWVLVHRVAYREVFAPAMPPAFEIPLLTALVAGGLAYLTTVGLTTWRRLSRFDVCKALSAP